ncbi:HD domain-containing protein [Fervidibacter sacchari]|uniref:Bifunctional uridylyltransferase/uridylyl-removing enzyme n=1 Tax=Candidatus Fervidibacter sacchari TaxID=1448929 RepID=A0ABT2EIT4_9BACT|nr:HD domain-containing protein [Candidatus Fervidibacter sacchari]MCS3917849.1 [protein-PII] uridylyltransferase [Candidatus Fervidibacter sacchari]WKU15669.1 HD domain-containing protein [Candidatus Fervidibacter sacchari]
MSDWQLKVNDLIERVKAWRQSVLQTPPQCALISPLGETLSESLDNFVREIYELARERAMEKAGKHYIPDHSEIALLATGGYGRRELCAFSDIDIAFVPLEEDDPFVDALLRECFRLIVTVFMDNTDLKVGYGYRPLSDLPTLDTQTQAALMDARFVAGYKPLADELQRQLLANLDVLKFIKERERERTHAYQRFHASPLVTEPHLKEGAGGLRDGHTALWLIAALNRVRTDKAWRLLSEILPADEFQAFREGYDFINRVRMWLHLTAQRRQDVLLREYHHRIAVSACKVPGDEEEIVREFHRRLYRAMESLHYTFRVVQAHVDEAEIPLEFGFARKGNFLLLSNSQTLKRETQPPSNLTTTNGTPQFALKLMKAFELMQRYDLQPSAELLKWLKENAQRVSEIQANPEAAESFLAILTGVGDAPYGRVLELMAETGVLETYMPEWAKAARYVPSNAAHKFTVGEHVLKTVRELARLREAARQGEFPWVDVWNGVADEQVLFLAAFLHDLGKAVDEREHESIGKETAKQVGERLGLAEDRVNLLERLVRQHMVLLSTARLRDIYAPDTLFNCAKTVGDEAFLKMLLLHSFADARSVSELTFTEVEERLVLDLYFGVLRTLQEMEKVASVHVLARDRSRELQRALQDVSNEEIRIFCEAMPPGYLLSTPLKTIAIHCRMVQFVRRTGKPTVEVLQEPDSGFTEVVVCAPDAPQPGMLSQIAGTLFACDVDIRNAKVFTLPGDPPLVLDTLWVTSEGRPLSEAKTRRVQETLLSVLTGEESLAKVLERFGKPLVVPVQVRHVAMRNDISETHTVVHIVARDRKGLLFRLTSEIAALGLDIQTAKIVTWADIAEDAFYVIRKGVGKLPDHELPKLTAKLKERLSEG